MKRISYSTGWVYLSRVYIREDDIHLCWCYEHPKTLFLYNEGQVSQP